jgi:hypothetical protein
LRLAPEKLPGSRCGDSTACRVKTLEKLWWSFRGTAKKKNNKAVSAKKSWKEQMKFSGTLIEELMATVERAERRAHTNEHFFGQTSLTEASSDEPLFAMSMSVAIEPWIASVHEYPDFDTNFFDTNLVTSPVGVT